MLPLDRRFAVSVLEACDKSLAQIIHVHAADRDAANALTLPGQFFHGIARCIVAHIQPRAVTQPRKAHVFGINAQDRLSLLQCLPCSGLIGKEERRRSAALREFEVRIGYVPIEHKINP